VDTHLITPQKRIEPVGVHILGQFGQFKQWVSTFLFANISLNETMFHQATVNPADIQARLFI